MHHSIYSRFLSYSIFILVLLCFSTCQKEETQSVENLPGFRLHPDFQMELVAAEPIVFDPVAMQFDEKGRAFVLEMPGYPFSSEESRLILLNDANGDGIYDQRQVYAENLRQASSFMPYKEGMLVAAPPYLLYLRDLNSDNIAEDRQIIMDGFSEGNLQHNFNGLTYGLDNWIYAANGGNSGQPFFNKNNNVNLDMRGDDFRFRIEEVKLERYGESSGGFELAFDNWGHLFETHNLEHVSHLVFPARYTEGLPVEPGHSLVNASDHEENGLSRIYPVGEQESRVNHPEQSGYFSGACGITFYGGGAFPEAFNNNLFVADVVLNLVHLDVLSPDKAAFKTSRMREKTEFLASTDRAFRPVNFSTGPDGSLYLIDMYREVIEHPEWIPDEIEATLDLKAGKDQGRIYRITPRGKTMPAPVIFDDLRAIDKMVKALESPNQWVRLTAQRLLVPLRDEALVPALEDLFQNTEKSLARLHGMWILEEKGKFPRENLNAALADPEAGIRENAIKILEPRLKKDPEWANLLINMTGDPNARVRMQAALSLSALAPEHYPLYAEAITYAASQMLRGAEVDTWIAQAATVAGRQDPVAFCQKVLEASPAKPTEFQIGAIRSMAQLTGQQWDSRGAQTLLNLVKGAPHLESGTTIAMLEGLATGWETRVPPNQSFPGVLKILEEIETGGQVAVIRASGRLRQAMGLPVSSRIGPLLARATTAVLDDKLPVTGRLEHLELLALENFNKREAFLYELLDNRQPLAIQEAALWQLWHANKPRVGPELLQRWPNLGPDARKGAGNILLYKSYHHDLLLTALEDGRIKPGELNLDLERRRVLLWSDDKQVRARAEALFSDARVVTRKEALEGMRAALGLAGDVAKGKELFTSLCSQCHIYDNLGKDAGPVLTEINRKSKESLLHDILDPNAAVDTKYLNHRIRTQDGSIHMGIVQRESDSEISLRMMGGVENTIPKASIEELISLGVSMMPEGLEGNMSPQDMADLLAFLQQPSS